MSEHHVYDVPAEWAKRAFVDNAKYLAMYEHSMKDPEGFWARARPAHRLDQALHQSQERLVRPAQRLDQVVRGRRHQCRGQLRRPSSAQARQANRDHLGERRPDQIQAHHLRAIGRGGRPLRQCAEGARRQEGRPRHDLSADDPRSGLRDARLRAHRRDPLHRVRRLLARRARRPHRGLGFGGRHHRRRGHARRPPGAAQGQCRRRGRQDQLRQACAGRQTHRRRRRLGREPRRLVARGGGQGRARTARPSR